MLSLLQLQISSLKQFEENT